MQFTESWLKSLVNTPLNTQELGDKLTMAGLEVEELEPLAPEFSGVVVGLVVKKDKHPDADRLSVCQVQVAEGDVRQIVCGAPNVAKGLKVPCALPGAELPGGFKIKPTKMRGVESGGMLCSGKELGVPSDVDGLHILSEEFPVGGNVRELLGLNEMKFTLKMTPNRADCLSVWGVAREVAALTGATLNAPSFAPVVASISDTLNVKVESTDLCGRFAGRVIRGVNNSVKTPQWMVDRLEGAGQRSLNALVDISNYVMLELGRPSHVFDLDKVQGDLTVRWAREDEQLKLLNEMQVALKPHMGVICDANGPEALAGIMGGDHTAVNEGTTNIFVEAAFWHPDAIVGRAREFNFSSDASHRFERGVDFQTIPEHIERITALILEICGGQAGPVVDQVLNLPARKPVTLRHARAEMVIGMPFTVEQVKDVFTKLGFQFNVDGQGVETRYVVNPPSYRFDINIEEDLIEEVIRVVGYDSLPLRAPIGKLKMLPAPDGKVGHHAIRRQVAALGYQEVVSYSFTPEQWEADFNNNTNPVRLLNPIASHLSVMRSTLIGSLTGVLKHNLGHRVDRLRVFEVARVFELDEKVQDGAQTVAGFKQTWKVGGLAYGLADQLQWAAGNNRALDFFDVKGDVEQLLHGRKVDFEVYSGESHPALHPGRSARVLVNKQPVGFIGEMHPKLVQQFDLPHAPIVFELLLDGLNTRKVPVFKEVSKQPVVVRDLAFVVDQNIAAAQLKKAFTEVKDDNLAWLKSVILFDEFLPKEEGKGLNLNEKSLAFRLTLQASDRSLTDADIEPLLKKMIEQAGQRCSARLR
ncbi:phenylalanine--tRNA ligase subunit beta [Limnobacter parvus]|uniref:Phenylalanine--tRNA ligase beta subunit n=1 Tax=Limnobacter parvus TaxID=2939690 RepID=A0ABT1XHU9_9BURK|nr:phenylalanine--tRNA ligase subunit beta [Limnobacter parvus]MCR2746744.1 phenylalanine--tRNA ligase subunit beta [Limnobacter parvus]